MHFVVPDRFRGPVVMARDTESGAEAGVRDDKYVIEVPPDGRLHYRSFEMFEVLHEETAQFANGEELQLGDDDAASRTEERVRLWYLGRTTTSGGEDFMRWYVGTESQKDEYVRRE